MTDPYCVRTIQEAQLMLKTGSIRLVKINKHSTVLDIVSYCAIVTFFKISRFYDIRLQKCRDLEIGSEVTQGY